MKRAAKTPTRNRPRKKAAALEVASTVTSDATPAAPEAAAPTGYRNVGELEGVLSVGLGVLFVIAALFPRSVKQLVMLSLGGGLLYRGMTGHCAVYEAMEIDHK